MRVVGCAKAIAAKFLELSQSMHLCHGVLYHEAKAKACSKSLEEHLQGMFGGVYEVSFRFLNVHRGFRKWTST